jgi:hypothetical protein
VEVCVGDIFGSTAFTRLRPDVMERSACGCILGFTFCQARGPLSPSFVLKYLLKLSQSPTGGVRVYRHTMSISIWYFLGMCVKACGNFHKFHRFCTKFDGRLQEQGLECGRLPMKSHSDRLYLWLWPSYEPLTVPVVFVFSTR